MSALDGLDTLLRRPRSRAAFSSLSRVDDSSVTRRLAMRTLPQVLQQRFVPSAAAGLTTVYELRVVASGGGDEERFALIVSDGVLAVERRPAPDAKAWVAVSLGDMIKMVSGSAYVWELMANKRLEVGGDVFTVMRFPGLLGL